MIELDCGDNSCLFAKRPLTGMRTNGGCRCIPKELTKLRIFVHEKIEQIAALEALGEKAGAEIQHLRSCIRDQAGDKAEIDALKAERDDLQAMMLEAAPPYYTKWKEVTAERDRLREALIEIASGNRTTHEAINWARLALKQAAGGVI